MSEIIIHTNRLFLKGISSQVIHDVFAIRSEDEVKTFFGVDDKRYQHLREMYEKGMETHRFSLFFFLLIQKDTNQPIGECGFHTWNKIHRRAELFYILRDDAHKGKGFMTEALTEVIKYGFQRMELHRIAAFVASINIPSIKLLQKNGFSFEGTMREDYNVDDKFEDSDCYSLLKHEWQSTSLGNN